MAVPNSLLRIIGTRDAYFLFSLTEMHAVPLGLAVSVARLSIYDVPGGYRAVMFDRFSGVQDKVGLNPCC
jgi:prohibitin 1